jgi:hypothetical protein
MKKLLLILPLVFLLCFTFGCSQRSISLKKIFENDLDTDLQEKIDTSRQQALSWQADARLYEVRLNISDKGEISWRFHWISDSSKNYIALFSNTPSVRQTGDDPNAEEKPDVDIKATIGFNKVGEILQAEGVNLEALKVEDIWDFKLSNERKWEDPNTYYYYLFLKDGSQYYIQAETGELKK